MSEMIKKENSGEVATAEMTRTCPNYNPRFDIIETEEELVLYGDMPGVSSEKLDVSFENERLIIHGSVENRHQDEEFIYGEYGIGDYHREFQVFENVDADKISADLKNGVLCIHLPKTEDSKPRRIEVKPQ